MTEILLARSAGNLSPACLRKLPAIFFAMLLCGCSSIQQAASSIGIGIEFPALEQLGYAPSGHNFAVVNDTPLHAVVVVYGAAVALLRPGEAVKSTRHWEPLRPQIPVVVLFYRDRERRSYVGSVGRVWTYASPKGTAIAWRIGAGEIQTPNSARAALESTNSGRLSSAQIKVADFPTESWNETAAIQIVNNTTYLMTVSVNGERKANSLPPGEYYYTGRRHMIGDDTSTVSIHVMFTDQGQRVGTYDYTTSVVQGVIAHQLIIGNNAIRRQ